ncbi:MAG: hypothetical protein WD733_08620 [Bryobacterales bacterium]
MACPYFSPTRRLNASEWRSRIRPPLGEAYEGECHARPTQIYQPARALLLEGCNLGYASSLCSRFPAEAEAEAVRFCVCSDDGAVVAINYVLERAHLPCKHGPIAYDRRFQRWQGIEAGSLMERQAQAYLESYLAWKDGDKTKGAAQKSEAKGLAAARNH